MVAVVQSGPVMSNIELECPVAGCNFGEAGGRYKTPLLPSGDAVQLLNIHNQNHTQAQGAACISCHKPNYIKVIIQS